MKWRSLVVGLVAAATAAVPVFARMDVETQVVIPRPIGGYTANPGMGWQYGPGAGRTQLTETVAYRRSSYGWARLNPRPGVYDFGRLDRELDRVQAVGKQLAFRIYTMRGEHHGGHEIPQWVLASGARLLSNGEPDYGSCVYQRRWGAMVEELRRRYDGNPAIAWVDISGYGNFNEWSWQDQTRWEAVPSHPRTVDGMARNRLADMFIGGSGAVTCRGVDGRPQRASYDYAGWEHTQLLMPAAGVQQSSRYVAMRDRHVGIRHDCLGSARHQEGLRAQIGDLLNSVWRRAPIVYEMCAGSTQDREYVAAAEDLLTRTHATAVHGNLTGRPDPDVIEKLLTHVGYRYVLRRAEFSTEMSSGRPARVELLWANTGSAPTYPRMGQSFEVEVGLRNAEGRMVVEGSLPADVAAWMPRWHRGEAVPVNPVTGWLDVPGGLRPGSYTVTVAIVDRRIGRPINLAIAGRGADGRYDLGEVQVGRD